jgi:hypothetical protein
MTVTEVDRTAAEPPVVEPGQLRDTLRRAKELLVDEWAQGDRVGLGYQGVTPSGPYCVSTALWAAGVPTADHESWDAAIRALGFTHGLAAVKWNDKAERTHDDVIALFDRALTTSDREAVAP